MALATATIAYDFADLTGNDFDVRRTRVWASTNVSGETLVDTDADKIRLGCGYGTLGADGTGSVQVWIPGTGSNPASWQTTIHVDYPDRHGRATRSFGPFTITESKNLADLVAEMPVQPEYALTVLNRIDGVVDHGNVSGALELDSDISTHWLDATGPTVLTLTDGPSGGTRYVSVLVASGADNVTIAGIEDVTLTDGGFATFAWVRGSWILAGSGASGEAPVTDVTPPSAPTSLVVTPGSDGVTASAAFTPGTDAESTAKHRYVVYPTAGSQPAWPTSGAAYNITSSPIALTGLSSGTAYTMKVQSYSAGGSQPTVATATFTTPTPAGWNVWDSIDFTAQTDGTFASPKDFTTTGSRTLRATSSGSIVVADNLTTNGDYSVTSAFSGSVVPDAMRASVDYNLARPGGGYGLVEIKSELSTGGVAIYLEENWSTGLTRRAVMTQDYGTGVVYSAGPGFTLEGSSVNGIANSGEVTVELDLDEQLVKVLINGALVLQGDYSLHSYSLVGGFRNLRVHNRASVTGLTLETYS